ncbi:hypothetical protein FHU33_4902 [Blastococcus colisei]|uniref:Uncharacterized protein n=1 Tax=Blastococcus colisei TaxID=1564162 RepID=A0A543NV17_9ACTN|nr:hypothetical protein [Blastococcus colisei]TQN35674.1 hypothetical protein FHU33_4902 [Blastococcus colisei]
MTTSQLDDAFEAYLAGRLVPAEAAPLALFADSVREMSARPGRPSAGLAELLVTGLLTGSVDGSTEPAPTARGAAATALPGRSRRRSRMFTVLAAGLAKFASAGAVAHATAGVGVALAGVTSAGAAGVLPAPIQDGVATTIEAVTPFELPDSADDRASLPEQAGVPETGAPDELPGPADIPAGPDFGTSVSDDAQDGGVDGGQVSSDARATHQPEQPSATTAVPERPAAPAPAGEGPARAPKAPASAPQAPAPAPAPAAEAPAGGQAQGGTGRP